MYFLQIGGTTYAVVYRSRIVDEDGEELVGEVDYETQTIALRYGLHVDFTSATLLHEIIHVILHQSGHTLEEGVVNALAYGLRDLLQLNNKRKILDPISGWSEE